MTTNRNQPDPRQSRDLEVRETGTRPKQWSQPELLPKPNPRPGLVHRYVRMSTLGTDDPMNMSRMLREGWEPVKASDYPEISFISGSGSAANGNIEIGGLVLCAAPSEFMEQRDAHYKNLTRQQQEAVDNNLMRENDKRMPLFNERSSKVSFGSGE